MVWSVGEVIICTLFLDKMKKKMKSQISGIACISQKAHEYYKSIPFFCSTLPTFFILQTYGQRDISSKHEHQLLSQHFNAMPFRKKASLPPDTVQA